MYFNHSKNPLPAVNIVAGLILYFGIYFFLGPYILDYFAHFFANVSKAYYLIELVFYILTAGIMLFLARPVLEESTRNQGGQGKRNFKVYLKSVGMMYLSMIVLNLIINMVTGLPTSENQMAINELAEQYPFVILLLSVFLAPLVEELVFRGLIFRFIREYNMALAVLVSSVLFGGMHVFESIVAVNLADVLYILTYSALGYFLTMAYEKTGSIYTNIAMHMTLNGISFLLMLFTGLI